MPMGVHQHDGESLEFLFTDESNGTRSAFILLGMIFTSIRKWRNGTIDELTMIYIHTFLSYSALTYLNLSIPIHTKHNLYLVAILLKS